MENLRKNLSQIRVPDNQSHVYKDECVYSYDTPVSIMIQFSMLFYFISLTLFFIAQWVQMPLCLSYILTNIVWCR